MKSTEKLVKSEEEWEKSLSSEQFKILRKKGTERAWSSGLLEEKRKGVYSCAGCGNEVFSSDAKFDSGTGWPSFFDVIKSGAVDLKRGWDLSVEVVCGRCGGHLGHVFQDGPKPTGKRFCINGEALKFSKL